MLCKLVLKVSVHKNSAIRFFLRSKRTLRESKETTATRAGIGRFYDLLVLDRYLRIVFCQTSEKIPLVPRVSIP